MMDRKFANVAVSLVVAAALSGCGLLNSKWNDHYQAAQKALKTGTPAGLAEAEKELKEAIDIAWKDRVNEKEFVHVYTQLGDVLMEEKKYDEASLYLVRTLQFGNARRTNVDQNVTELRKLIHCYELAGDWEQAAQTEHVLVRLIEFEKSPQAPEYAVELARQKEFKTKLAHYTAKKPQVAEAVEHEMTPAEQKANENMLTGWH